MTLAVKHDKREGREWETERRKEWEKRLRLIEPVENYFIGFVLAG